MVKSSTFLILIRSMSDIKRLSWQAIVASFIGHADAVYCYRKVKLM